MTTGFSNQRISVHIPQLYLSHLAFLCEHGCYPTRSEAIRVAVRDLLKSELGSLLIEPLPNFTQLFTENQRITLNPDILKKINDYFQAEHCDYTTYSQLINRAVEFFFTTLENNGSGM